MSDAEKMVTERVASRRERNAFAAGIRDARDCSSTSRLWSDGAIALRAKRRYPLPLVTRPRVVTDVMGCRWRVRDGLFEWNAHSHWNDLREAKNAGMYITADRVRVLADLLANPTETVPDEDANA